MSGTVAEALLATGSKKVPLLPPPAKVKKEPMTFRFDLKLAESNDATYPEFSWIELVRNAKQQALVKVAQKGNPVLDPFASDDEEDLKAMAAKFEAKYNTVVPVKKKKRREDFIDKGAGYDETDPFIDNSDVYDEVVPPDLQTVHGGFYINSGSLDFKEVELSEDDDDSISQPAKLAKMDRPQDKLASTCLANLAIQKVKKKVGRPPGILNKGLLSISDKSKIIKKRKLIITPTGSDGRTIIKHRNSTDLQVKSQKANQESTQNRTENSKQAKPLPASSSSSSSTESSSSDDSSSSSESESSTEDIHNDKKEKLKEGKSAAPPKPLKLSTHPFAVPKSIPNPVRITNANVPSVAQNPALPKRLKTKNVPLNPKLHPNLATASVSSTPPIISTNSIQQQQLKVLNKDLSKANSNGGGNLSTSPRVQSPLGTPVVSTSTGAIRVPTPKCISSPSGSISSGLTILPVTPHLPKPSSSNNITTKQKMKSRQPSNIPPQITQLDVFQSLANANYPNLSNLPNLSFSPTIASNAALLKAGLNMSMNSQKSMPNLKKLPQSLDKTEKVLHKQTKLPGQGQKLVKAKSKPSTANLPLDSSTAHSASISPANANFAQAYISSLTGQYKTPPPLAGPGVEASKHRTPPTTQVTTAGIKTSSHPRSLTSSPHVNAVAMALSSASPMNTNSYVNSGYSAVISSSPNTLLANSIPSSLTVQRLSQSVTITPSSHSQTSYSSIGDRASMSNSKGSSATQFSVGVTDIKPVKHHNSAFDVSSLLQNSVINFSGSSVITVANPASTSKLGTAKLSNSVDRDLQTKK